MPITTRKLKSGKFQNVEPGGRVLAKSTTKKKATAQERIINMIKHGITPKGGWRKR